MSLQHPCRSSQVLVSVCVRSLFTGDSRERVRPPGASSIALACRCTLAYPHGWRVLLGLPFRHDQRRSQWLEIKMGCWRRLLILLTLCTPLSPAAQAADTLPVVLASGTLQKCLGIAPGAARMSRGPATRAFCAELPGNQFYQQAGARFQAGDKAGAAQLVQRAAEAGNAL